MFLSIYTFYEKNIYSPFVIFFSLEFVKGQTSKLGYEVSDSAGVLELVKWERKDSIVDLTKEDNLKQVKAIGNCCFVFNDYIKTVILPEGGNNQRKSF